MAELRFTKEHEWVRVDGDEAVVGITKFATRMLGDMVEHFAQLHPPLPRRQPLDSGFWRAGAAGDRVDIARIGNQGCIGQCQQARAGLAPIWRGDEIVGETPACIERHPRTGHTLVAQERLEPHQGGHGEDLVAGIDQRNRRGLIRNHIRIPQRLFPRDSARAQPRLDIGMRFIDDNIFWVRFARGDEQREIGVDVSCRRAD